MKKILIINGPNLNLLGTRQPEVYGKTTLTDIENALKKLADELKVEVSFFQSNHEGEIVTSVAIRDAIAAVDLPAIEVHISNIYSREDFRHNSFMSPVCIGQIAGMGIDGYLFALRKLASL